MSKDATDAWSRIKEKYWDREWDVDEMLAEDEHSHGHSATLADDD